MSFLERDAQFPTERVRESFINYYFRIIISDILVLNLIIWVTEPNISCYMSTKIGHVILFSLFLQYSGPFLLCLTISVL